MQILTKIYLKFILAPIRRPCRKAWKEFKRGNLIKRVDFPF